MVERRRFFSFRYVPSERRRSNHRGAFTLLAAVFLFFLCSRTVLSTGRVTDVSMRPTLSEGQFLLINRYVYRWASPRRGEIVVLRTPGKPRWLYVKRVVGLAEETLAIRNGRVVIDGKPLNEPYARGSTGPDMEPVRIPSDSVFVLGDNRAESEDSRHFGVVARAQLVGKVRPDGRFPLR